MKGENQKQKLLYLLKTLFEETDDEHALSSFEIIELLKKQGVEVERKALYRDIEQLKDFGFDVLKERRGRNVFYHIGHREFELPELKLLVDCVQSSKFITEKKSQVLIKKLEGLTSKYEAKHLQRQVILSGRVKSPNEKVYYNVDQLHEAINSNRKIRFKYYQWTVEKDIKLRRNGSWYTTSPWCLMWDDEYYYMVAYDSNEAKIKHYRVDKMLNITITDESREGQQEFSEFNVPLYAKSVFGMFGGKLTHVTFEGDVSLVGVLIDRFGKDISIRALDENRFSANVDVVVSQQFIGWLIALGESIKIVAPSSVVDRMKDEIVRLNRQYMCE